MASSKRKLGPLYLILGITFVPLVLAYVAYYTGFGVPTDTVNEGTILKPVANVKELVAAGGGPSFDSNLKWRLLIPVRTPCDEGCERDLYLTRQVHIRLGEKSERVERWAVNLSGEAGRAYLQSIAAEHPKLQIMDIPDAAFAELLAGTNAPPLEGPEHFYLLVDQIGFAMMFYTTDQSGNQLLKDLKRVLKYSPDE